MSNWALNLPHAFYALNLPLKTQKDCMSFLPQGDASPLREVLHEAFGERQQLAGTYLGTC